MTDKVNESRRNLLIATSVVGAIGAGFAAVPFIASWMPSERAKSAGGPVEANFSKLEMGQKLDVSWRGQPIFIVKRDQTQLATLPGLSNKLKDPDSEDSIQPESAKNLHRSQKQELLVMVGICTHLGCSPKYYPEIMPQVFDSEWQGGFYCPCHNSKFDISGRVYKGAPAGTNLVIPPYVYVDEGNLIIGLESLEGEA
ncbi:Ubiquinol-cytochrome C reductase iron-sulfur subunit [hydrothermal vent metagenome]|uniref:Ubiquinol-cytochrome c reductase iron-sulfur subunit n=1 Tax=hydrothermal vent metagenome TaxID=652676 RepID=A0A3B0V1M1_9ZZZZ